MLHEISAKYGTDKYHHGFATEYHKYFEAIRNDVKSLLEIGILDGGSLRMWRDYFPNAEIYIIEFFEDEYRNLWQSPDTKIPNVTVISGNQSYPSTWEEIPNVLDVVIDDGSHVPEDQIASVELGFSKLKSKGLWFIEDTHCNFHKNYNVGGDKLYHWIMNMVVKQQIPYLSTMGDFYKIQPLLKGIEKNIFAYHLYKSMIVLEKS